MNQKSFCLTAGILARKSCTAAVLINSHLGCFHLVNKTGRPEDRLQLETGSFPFPGLALDALGRLESLLPWQVSSMIIVQVWKLHGQLFTEQLIHFNN